VYFVLSMVFPPTQTFVDRPVTGFDERAETEDVPDLKLSEKGATGVDVNEV
jgi:hypothetical protein